MARITKGILGGFSGKVGANWRGQDIIRSIPKPSSRPPSEKQLLQQNKFKLVISFLQPLRNIQSRYFGSGSGSKSRVNMAASYTISEALQVTADVPSLVYNKILITKGDLTGFQNVTASVQSGNQISLSWEDNSLQGNASLTDSISIVCYGEELGRFEILESLALRPDLSVDVTLPADFNGKAMEVYAFISNEMQISASTSFYLGQLQII
ncbi:hypothetical protein AR686_09870 [Chryseobacterium aquaticum subsp. greenlandense]|uniref:Uncharacterized protein n=2 Tax=Chryseobacterium group TaxID=2782232 RepID=A0A101CIZ5_9FLAO|nr:hypothetical protein AC804_15605 [Chryseobacterium sp. Hurlbut01]KUJ56845.1 hypothetical protein AR686_09870 [Chryseobacterium aquaticum subsp. greenlandense]